MKLLHLAVFGVVFISVFASTFAACKAPIHFYDSTIGNGFTVDKVGNNAPGSSGGNFITGNGGVGPDGQVMEFHGQAWVTFQPYTQITTNSLSISMWVYLNSYTTWATFLKHWSGSSSGQFHLGIHDSTQLVSCFITQGNGQAVAVTSNIVFPLASWTHVAFVADSAASRMKLYFNGAEVASAAYSGTISSSSPLSYFTTGAKLNNPITPDGSYPGWLNGRVDELMLYDVALSASEVQQIASKQVADGVVGCPPTDPPTQAPTVPPTTQAATTEAPTAPPAPTAAPCTTQMCGGTDSCITDTIRGQICFNPTTHRGLVNLYGTFLCGFNDEVCGSGVCYDPTTYHCCGTDRLEHISNAC